MTQVEDTSGEKRSAPKERHVGLIVALLTLLILVPLGFKLYSSYLQKRMIYMEKLAEKKRLQQELDRLEKENKRLTEHRQFLQTKPGVEKIARDKLGLTKPGEIPFIVIPRSAEDDNRPEPVKDRKQTKSDKTEDKAKTNPE